MKIKSSLWIKSVESLLQLAGILLIIMASVSITITVIISLFLSGYLNHDNFIYAFLTEQYQPYLTMQNSIAQATLKPMLFLALLIQAVFHIVFFQVGIKIINRERISIVLIFMTVAVQFFIFGFAKDLIINAFPINPLQLVFIKSINTTLMSLTPYNLFYFLPVILSFVVLGKIIRDNFNYAPKNKIPTLKKSQMLVRKINPGASREVKTKHAMRSDSIEWRKPEFSKQHA
ncbi:MAG: hypothetical protein V4629_10090 [Pseudomonadota bacterium]